MSRTMVVRSRPVQTSVLVIVLVTVALMGIRHPSQSLVTAFPSLTDSHGNWAPTFMQWPLGISPEQAVDMAKKFDVISATKRSFGKNVPLMKAANPDLKMLVYMNGAFTRSFEANMFPADWYAYDANGRKITTTEFGDFLMAIWNPAWVDKAAAICHEFLLESGFDGCLVDAVGTASLRKGYVTGQPINPQTGQPFTKAEWLRAASDLMARIKARVGGPLVVPNGIRTGPEYFDPVAPTKMLMDNADGGFVELFVRGPKDGISQYRSEERWKKDVDMLVAAGAAGTPLLTVTKVWTTGTQAQKDQWHRYAFGTFLLGTNGRHYFNFIDDKDTITAHPMWMFDIGVPSGAYAKINGVYQRTFTKGKVLVNPTTSTFIIPLGGTYIDSQNIVRTSVTLTPHTASILKKRL